MTYLKGEIWKPVIHKGVDFSSDYEVSNMGRVKSIKLVHLIMNGYVNNQGYRVITLRKPNHNLKSVKVHTLVADAFLRERKNNEVIDHINSIKHDNNLNNLRIISHRHNCSIEKTIKSKLPCGVKVQNGKINSTILMYSVRLHLGIYNTVEQAQEAYKIALNCHNEGANLLAVIKLVDEYRISIGLKPIKRRVKN